MCMETLTFTMNILKNKHKKLSFSFYQPALDRSRLRPYLKYQFFKLSGSSFMNRKKILTLLFIVLSVVETTYASIPDASSSVYHLQSNHGAAKVIYLDFDGQYVNSASWKNNNTNFPGQAINALAANVSETDIITIWKTVREDFMPFNVNVTTDSMIFKQASYGQRQMCIFTPSSEWCGQLGISLFGSFNYDEPCFAFTLYNKGKAAAEVASHELGHTFGLSHDGLSVPYTDYYNGHGTDPNTWSPLASVCN